MSRIDQINELVRQELAKIILEEADFAPGVLVTVLSVDTSETLEDARVWVSIFPEAKCDSVMKYLNKNIGLFQDKLNKKLFLRFVPKIAFKLDKTEGFAHSLDDAFKEIEETSSE